MQRWTNDKDAEVKMASYKTRDRNSEMETKWWNETKQEATPKLLVLTTCGTEGSVVP